MINREQKYLAALAHFPKFGPRRLKKLLAHFPTAEAAFTASAGGLRQAGIEDNVAEEFVSLRPQIQPDAIAEQMARENIAVVDISDENYPPLLKEIHDPPYLLFYRGRLRLQDEFSLAVVGTRKFTSYGRRTTERITGDLASQQLSIVSGLALGIDTIAHNACLAADGRTIAVLGTGLDKKSLYPSANRYLVEKIVQTEGVVVTEFPLGTAPLKHNFPQRNRIISGLARGVLVTEAGEKSGALITARYALEQNREVFAVPGSIFSDASRGPHRLIKEGAHPVTSAADILEALDLAAVAQFIDNQKIIPESEEEENILRYLSHEPRHVDELIRLTKLDTSAINATLTMMEMKGMVRNIGNMQYVLAR